MSNTNDKNLFKIVIVDDEQNAIDTLSNLINNFFPNFKILASFKNPYEAISALKNLEFDVLIIDIKMPEINGFEVIDNIKNKLFHLVFITAYEKFAIKALKANAIDYILKPVGLTELEVCFNKIMDLGKISYKTESEAIIDRIRISNFLESTKDQSLYHKDIIINSGKNYHIISIDKINRIQTEDFGIRIFLNTRISYFTDQTLKDVELLLDPNIFIRCHISHIINKNAIVRFTIDRTGEIQLNDGSIVPVSARRKNNFLKVLRND